MKKIIIGLLMFTGLAAQAASLTAAPTPGPSTSMLCNMAKNGNGSTVYYPNGQVMTYSSGHVGATWYHSNGKLMTDFAGGLGTSWYHSNGQILTYSAGNIGASWYYDNGSLISNSAGNQGATWYYKNGQVMFWTGPAMTEDQLKYPCDYIE